MNSSVVRSGQRRQSEKTRYAILLAARSCFSEESYDHVTIRSIAERCGCNSSLIGRYFGSKEGLFRAAVADAMRSSPLLDIKSADELANHLAIWVAGDLGADRYDPSPAIFRSASVTPAKEILREAIEQSFILPLSELISARQKSLRAEILASILYGLNAFRNEIRTDSLSRVDVDELRDILRPLLLGLIAPEA